MSNQSERRYRMLNQRQCAELIYQSPFPHPAAKPAEPTVINPLPSKAYCRRWMKNNIELDDCNEVNCTGMVETFAIIHPQCDHWLDDDTHWIWDLPVEIENKI
jgi:hypothetical protein